MDDDFNSAGAIGHIFDIARDVNLFLKGEDTPAKKLVLSRASGKSRSWETFSGYSEAWAAKLSPHPDLPPEVAGLLEERNGARAAKDWTRADEIRNQLAAQGYFLEDRPEGSIVRK